MPKFIRLTAVILLPVLTFALGLKIGETYEEKKLSDTKHHLEMLFSGQSQTGQVLYDPQQEVDITLLWSVWRLLLQNYIKPENLKIQPMLYGAVSGLVEAADDPYTVFMTPDEHDEFFQALRGDLEGIGAHLTMRNEQIVVIAPIKGSPAAKAGLMPEDVIVKVDGADIADESLDKVVQRIRGEKDTTVTLTIYRKNEPDFLDVVITRAKIHIPSVESEVIITGDGNVGYLALNRFGDESTQEVRGALEKLLAEKIEGLVFDLRNNGGGLLQQAVSLTSLFLPQGKVVTVQHRNGPPESDYVFGDTLAPEITMVVLINEGSASASEIVAGALQDHERAVLFGKKSFGKGTVQEVIDLPGGSSLRVSTARWLTPDGRDIGAGGIEPDWEVDLPPGLYDRENDTQLNAAVKYLLGVWEGAEISGEEKAENNSQPEEQAEDLQNEEENDDLDMME